MDLKYYLVDRASVISARNAPARPAPGARLPYTVVLSVKSSTGSGIRDSAKGVLRRQS